MKIAILILTGLAAIPAYADHPGGRLDEVMAQKEPAFSAIDRQGTPALSSMDADGAPIDLERLSDQVVVLSFLPAACGTSCAEQQALLEKVREGVAASAMRDMVTFLTVSYADVSGGADGNGVVVRPQGRIEDVIERFRTRSPQEFRAPLVHVIARGGRHAGIFEGAAFRPINMVLYVNGLTNEHEAH